MAFETIPSIPGEANLTKIYRHRLRGGPPINNKRFAEIPARVDSVDESLGMNALRRYGRFGRCSLIFIRVGRGMAHDAQFGLVPLFPLRPQLQVANRAIARRARRPPG